MWSAGQERPVKRAADAKRPYLVFLDVQIAGLERCSCHKQLLDRRVPMPKMISLLHSLIRGEGVEGECGLTYILKQFAQKASGDSLERETRRRMNELNLLCWSTVLPLAFSLAG